MRAIHICAIALILLFFSGCILPSQQRPPHALIPASATSVLIFNAGVILADPDFRELYRTAFPGKSIDDELQPIREIGGIDARDAEEAAIFSLEDGSKSNSAMIIKGPFNFNEIERRLSSSSDWVRGEYNGNLVFTNTRPEGPLAVAFAGGDLVLGGEQAVKAVIDVEHGAPSISQNPKLSRIFSSLHQDAVLSFAKEIRSGERENLSSSVPLNISNAFADARAAGLSVQKQGAAINMRGVIIFGSSSGASTSKSATDGLIMLLASYADSGGSVQSLLSKIQDYIQNDMLILELRGTTLQELSSAKAEFDRHAEEKP